MQTPQNENLVVRQHERVKCALAAEVSVGTEHAEIVKLASLVSDGQGVFSARVVDISRGGFALRTSVFMPKHVRLVVRITDGSLLAAGQTVVLSAVCKVMRVSMIDRAPGYELGTAFVNMSAEEQQAVSGLIKRVAEMQAVTAAPVAAGEAPRA
jgi:hypothetical protein